MDTLASRTTMLPSTRTLPSGAAQQQQRLSAARPVCVPVRLPRHTLRVSQAPSTGNARPSLAPARASSSSEFDVDGKQPGPRDTSLGPREDDVSTWLPCTTMHMPGASKHCPHWPKPQQSGARRGDQHSIVPDRTGIRWMVDALITTLHGHDCTGAARESARRPAASSPSYS